MGSLMRHVVCVLACVSLLAGVCQGKNCVMRDKCNCVFDDDSGMVDIWSLARTDGVPLFFDVSSAADIYMYSYNPCYGFTEGSCIDVAVCQYDYQFFGYYELGGVESVDFSYDGLNVVATYTSADGARTTHVNFVCDPSATEARVDVMGETSFMDYEMTVTAAAACPIAANSGGAMSAGSVLLIIFFVVLFVYLIAGVGFNKYKRQAAGKDLLPNKDFWFLIPSLAKDGCRFVAGLVCRGRKTVYTSI